MRAIYIADDGTRFETEEECMEYEEKQMFEDVGNEFIAFDNEYERIPFEQLVERSDEFRVVKFTSARGKEVLNHIYLSGNGYCYLGELYENSDDEGVYMVDPHDDETWIDKREVQRRCEEYKNALRFM